MNLSFRTKVKILKKKNLGIFLKKNLVPHMLSHRGKGWNIEILAKIEGKEANFFFENLRRAYKDLI